MSVLGTVRVGISDWTYPPWRGKFYPAKLAHHQELAYVFLGKRTRFITHMRRLINVRIPLANFLASGVLRLGEKLGPILWQLPPNFKFDRKRLESFFKLLPRDTESAAALARRHNDKLKSRAWMKTDATRKLRHCIEIQNTTFLVAELLSCCVRMTSRSFAQMQSSGRN